MVKQLTDKEIRSLLNVIERDLKWDLIDKAKEIQDDITEFENFFRRYHSKLICDLIFNMEDSNLPLYMGTKDKWLEVIIKWRLSFS